MSIWFEGATELECNMERVRHAVADLGELWVGVVSLMPGLSEVELLEQGADFVVIKTNEGVMRRTNIVCRDEGEKFVVEFDEEYQAGRMVTATGHFRDEFSAGSTGVNHRMVIANIKAPGFLGFFYRKFAGPSIGKALLNSCKEFLERD